MMIHTNLIINAVKEVLHLNLRCLAECLIPRMLIGKPDFTCPEAVSPVVIFNRFIKIVHTVGILEFIRKLRQIFQDLCC